MRERKKEGLKVKNLTVKRYDTDVNFILFFFFLKKFIFFEIN